MILDRLLGAVAPGVAAQRAENRLRMALADARRTLLQGYDAAAVGGRQSGWRRPQTSADAETRPALAMLRASARDLVRNDPHANRAVRVLTAHIVGVGVRPRPVLEDGETSDQPEVRASREQWSRFVENCDPEGRLDFYGQQRLVARAVIEGGEALRLWIPVGDGGRLRWRTRILEGDWLDQMRDGETSGGGRIVQGVEFDRLGRRVAYWLHSRHPGDRFGGFGTRLDSRRVEARYVDHVFETLRPGQVRGVSWLAPVAVVLRDLGDLAEAEIVRKKLEACIAAVVTNANDDGETSATAALNPATDDDGSPLTTAGGDPIERLSPGMVMKARPGWDVDFHAPTASGGLVEHMRERLHAVAAGVGATYHQISGDLSQANYSSQRGGLTEFWQLVDGWQDDLMVMQTGRPAWRRVMQAGVVNGTIAAPRASTWIRPRRPWVDPKNDAIAARMNAESGIESLPDLIERGGEDPDDRLRELARWRDAVEALGLGLTIDYAKETPRARED